MLITAVLVLLLQPIALQAVHNTVNTWGGLLQVSEPPRLDTILEAAGNRAEVQRVKRLRFQYDEDWGYADIRADSHTFWWLYAVKPANGRPLILWLQVWQVFTSVFDYLIVPYSALCQSRHR